MPTLGESGVSHFLTAAAASSLLLVPTLVRKHLPSFATTPATRRRMQQQARVNTAPEVALRRELHRRGMRYQLHRRVVPSLRRRLDIVFISARVAVEVRGCFWHHCPLHGVIPKSNVAWWTAKLGRNVERDLQTEVLLREAGWKLLIVWEHEDPSSVAARVERLVRANRRVLGGPSRLI